MNQEQFVGEIFPPTARAKPMEGFPLVTGDGITDVTIVREGRQRIDRHAAIGGFVLHPVAQSSVKMAERSGAIAGHLVLKKGEVALMAMLEGTDDHAFLRRKMSVEGA